jgi:hypothetical protein
MTNLTFLSGAKLRQQGQNFEALLNCGKQIVSLCHEGRDAEKLGEKVGR